MEESLKGVLRTRPAFGPKARGRKTEKNGQRWDLQSGACGRNVVLSAHAEVVRLTRRGWSYAEDAEGAADVRHRSNGRDHE